MSPASASAPWSRPPPAAPATDRFERAGKLLLPMAFRRREPLRQPGCPEAFFGVAQSGSTLPYPGHPAAAASATAPPLRHTIDFAAASACLQNQFAGDARVACAADLEEDLEEQLSDGRHGAHQ